MDSNNNNIDEKSQKQKKYTESKVENCRFYEQQYPQVDELVMAEVKSIEEMGAYVALKEYNNIEGMILLSELSRRRIRSINKIIRVGRLECVMVLRVDQEKGYIDLSKRRVSEEEVGKCEERYQKAKTVHSILRHVAEVRPEIDKLEDLYVKFGWPVEKKHGNAYDAFKKAMTLNDDKLLFQGLSIEEDLQKCIMENIRKRMTPQKSKIRADIEVHCFEYEGIEAVKKALHKGEEVGTEELPVKIQLVAPPLYVVHATSTDKEQAVLIVKAAIEAIDKEITAFKGECKVKVEPRAVSDRDMEDFKRELKMREEENQEDVETDEEEESEEE